MISYIGIALALIGAVLAGIANYRIIARLEHERDIYMDHIPLTWFIDPKE